MNKWTMAVFVGVGLAGLLAIGISSALSKAEEANTVVFYHTLETRCETTKEDVLKGYRYTQKYNLGYSFKEFEQMIGFLCAEEPWRLRHMTDEEWEAMARRTLLHNLDKKAERILRSR